MRRAAPALLAGVFTLTAGISASAEVYKWTDADGRVHFSEKKPADTVVETVKIRAGQPSPEAQERLEKTLEKNRKARTQAAKTDEDVAREARNAAIKKRNCEKARAHLVELERVVRLYHTDDQGNRVRVGEDERQADIAEMKKAMAENCAG